MAARVLAHYARTAALLDASFSGSAIVFADFPRGLHARPHFRVTQIPLSTLRIGWLVQREYAVEFHGSGAPLESEPDRLRYGRIALEPPRNEHRFSRIRDAALLLREQLRSAGYDAIPVVDGLGGIVLWLPFSEAPPATKIRARLKRLCGHAAARYPSIFKATVLPSEQCVRLDVSVNAPAQYGVLPYSLRGTPALPMAAPVTWDELAALRATVVCTAETWPQRFQAAGDLFSTLTQALRSQRLLRPRTAGIGTGSPI